MQLLKGTEVLLNGEPVQNVLIGQAVTAESQPLSSFRGRMIAYTLGIPRGDPHTWVDSVVEFFGERFRTLGFPERGIAENIPAPWDRNVHIERLLTTGTVTVYDSAYQRHCYALCYAHDARQTVTTRTGMQTQGDLTVHIYADGSTHYVPRIGDIVVPSACGFVFDTSDERALSESMRAFRAAYPEHGSVQSVSTETFGILPDIDLIVR